MKIQNLAQMLPDGTIEPSHEIEVVCANCQDPVSAQEEETGTCTNCGASWEITQNVNVTVTSLPSIQGLTIKIG